MISVESLIVIGIDGDQKVKSKDYRNHLRHRNRCVGANTARIPYCHRHSLIPKTLTRERQVLDTGLNAL